MEENRAVVAARQKSRPALGRQSPRAKAFSGCSKSERAGEAWPAGKNKVSGSRCGAPSYPNWTRAAHWIGRKVFWTPVSLRLKKGLRSWQNQARQGHQVDGGGPLQKIRVPQKRGAPRRLPLRWRLLKRGILLIVPHRKSRKKPPLNDGRELRRYSQALENRADVRLVGQLPPSVGST
jgi:hypothetical protein